MHRYFCCFWFCTLLPLAGAEEDESTLVWFVITICCLPDSCSTRGDEAGAEKGGRGVARAREAEKKRGLKKEERDERGPKT